MTVRFDRFRNVILQVDIASPGTDPNCLVVVGLQNVAWDGTSV